MKKFLGIILAVAMSVCFTAGCKDNFGAAVKTSAAIGKGIAQAETDTDGLAKLGLITAAEEKNVLDYFNAANVLNGQFQSCLASVKAADGKTTAILSCVNLFASGLSDPKELALLHVENPRAQAKVQTFISVLQIGLNTLSINISGSK